MNKQRASDTSLQRLMSGHKRYDYMWHYFIYDKTEMLESWVLISLFFWCNLIMPIHLCQILTVTQINC